MQHKTFGQRVREIRKSKGWTLEELAEKAGRSVGCLSMIENDKRQPSRNTAEALESAFGISTDTTAGGGVPASPVQANGLDDDYVAIPIRLARLAMECNLDYRDVNLMLQIATSIRRSTGQDLDDFNWEKLLDIICD